MGGATSKNPREVMIKHLAEKALTSGEVINCCKTISKGTTTYTPDGSFAESMENYMVSMLGTENKVDLRAIGDELNLISPPTCKSCNALLEAVKWQFKKRIYNLFADVDAAPAVASYDAKITDIEQFASQFFQE